MPNSHASDTTQAWARGLGNLEPIYVPPIASNPAVNSSPGFLSSHKVGNYGGAKIDVLAQRLAATTPLRTTEFQSTVPNSTLGPSIVAPSKNNFQNKAKQDWAKTLFKTPLFPALVAALLTIVVLSIIGPPFVKNNPTNPIYRPSLEMWKVILWGLVIGAIVYIIPLLYCKMKKK